MSVQRTGAPSAAPPPLARWMLRRLLPRLDSEYILADLSEQFLRSGRDGVGPRRWYWNQTLSLLSNFAWDGLRRRWDSLRMMAIGQARGGTVRSIWQDFSLGLRTLSRRPGFTLAAFLTLAIGIGANTTIFSLLNAILLRPFDYHESERLVIPSFANASRNLTRASVPYPDFQDWRAEADIFEGAAIVSSRSFDVADDGEPVRLAGLSVTQDYFSVMETAALVGRTFSPEEFVTGNHRVVILGDSLWRNRFSGRESILGGTIDLSGTRYEVVGVVPSDRLWPPGSELWTPLVAGNPPPPGLDRRDNFSFRVVARLAEGVSVSQADARLDEMARRVAEDPANRRAGWTVTVFSLSDWILVTDLRLALYVLMGAVGFILLIVCVNMANLMLARAIGRNHEVGIRQALGAGRGRLVRLLLAESLVLSFCGGLGGLGLAYLSLDFLKTVPLSVPRLSEASIDPAVLLFTFALAVVTALVFGSLPALLGTRGDGCGALSDSGRGSSPAASARRVRGFLVSAEVALALVMLIGAGLMIVSFARLYRADPGIRRDHLLTAGVRLPSARYASKAERDAFFDRLLERLRAQPGVRSAAAASVLPVVGQGINLTRSHLIEGAPEPPTGPEFAALWNVVSPDYFRCLGIPLVRGRRFEDGDRSGGPPVIIINESMAKSMFPEGDAVGKRIRSWRDENLLREVVGVVGDVRHFGMDDEKRPMVYVPHAQLPWAALGGLVVHTASDPAALADELRREVWAIDPQLPVNNIRVIDQILGQAVAPERFVTSLLVGFAAISVILAAIGIYGVISYAVGQQTYEIGIRMALGAQKRDVVRMIFRQSLILTALGTLIGLAASLGLWRLANSLLYQVSANDPWIYTGGALLLGAVALSAGLIPALRATRVDPQSALRCG